MRIVGMDIHRVAAEAVALLDGKLVKLGRIPMLRDSLEAFARTALAKDDHVVVEATGNAAAVALHLSPDFPNAVDAEVLGKDTLDPRTKFSITTLPAGIGLADGVLVIGRRGDRRQAADRLDPVGVAVFVDERFHRFNGHLSSAWAKFADAFCRISLAWRSSRASRRSWANSSFSALVRPARIPSSRSACRT